MGCGNPNKEDNPLFPLKQTQEAALTGRESEAALTGRENGAELTGGESEVELTGKGSEAPDSSQIFHENNTPVFTSFAFSSLPNSHPGSVRGIHHSYTRDPRIFNNIHDLMRHGSPQNVHSHRGRVRGSYSEAAF